MDYRDLTNLLLKIVGVTIIGYMVVHLPGYISSYYSLGNNSFLKLLGMVIVPTALPVALGCLLLFFPATISNKIIGGEKKKAGSSIDIDAVERIAFSVLGLYFLFRTISDFTYHLTSIYMESSSIDQSTLYAEPTYSYPLVLATFFEFLFALYLLFGAQGIVRLLAKLRATGVK